MQRELDPAAEAGAVDRRHGRERQRAQPAEELVAGTAPSMARAGVMFGNSVMSAPAAKKNGLPVINAAR